MPLSRTQETQLEFWQKFNDYVSKHPEFTNEFATRTPQANHHYLLRVGQTNSPYICLNAYAKDYLKASIFIKNNPIQCSSFEENKIQIENKVGCKLDWKTQNDKTPFSKIIAIKDGFDIYNRGQWKNAVNWLMNMAIKLKAVIEKYDK